MYETSQSTNHNISEKNRHQQNMLKWSTKNCEIDSDTLKQLQTYTISNNNIASSNNA